MTRPNAGQWIALWLGTFWCLGALALAEDHLLRALAAGAIVTGLLYWQLETRKQRQRPAPVGTPPYATTGDRSSPDVLLAEPITGRIGYSGQDPERRRGVQLIEPATEQTKWVKLGWSWTCFLFSSFFGLPLFLRGLTKWGIAVVSLGVVNLFWGQLPALLLITGPLGLAMTVFFGLKANELTIHQRLRNGWTFADSESEIAWTTYTRNTSRVTVTRVAVGTAGLLGLMFAVGLRAMIDEFGGLELMQAASEINRGLPMMIDRDTELRSTGAERGTFIYNLRLVNMSWADISPDRLRTELRPNLVQAACSTPDTRDAFLARGITLRYSYADRAGRHIADIDVRHVDCESSGSSANQHNATSALAANNRSSGENQPPRLRSAQPTPRQRQPNEFSATPPPQETPVRIGGAIKPPQKIKDVRPQYPAIAQSARVQGVVIIEATIGPDGKVQDTRLVRSIPLLDAAAIDAVRQWEFTPTVLAGAPVPVIVTVTVQFTLS